MQALLHQLICSSAPSTSPDGQDWADTDMGGAEAGRAESSVFMHTLGVLGELEAPEPQLADVCGGAEERRLLREMAVGDVSIEMLLSAVHQQQAGPGGTAGVTMTSETGDVLFDIAALYPMLMTRYEQYTARAGGGGGAGGGALGTPGVGGASELSAAAVKSALLYAQQYNTYVLLRGAVSAVAEAWAQAVEVAFTRQYEYLSAVPTASPSSFAGGGRGGGSPADALYEVLVATLESIRRILSARGIGGGGGVEALVLQMAGVARMLLSKLQEQVRRMGSLGR